MAKPSRSTPRRSQAQRRLVARGTLLDAALAEITTRGYAGLTTRAVARHAGVSLGGLQHYFPTKAQLAMAAIQHAVQQLIERSVEDIRRQESEREKARRFIDHLWVAHNLPLGKVIFALFREATVDLDIQRRIGELLAAGVKTVHGELRAALPGLSRHPGFESWLLLSETLMRGTVVVAALPHRGQGYAEWQTVQSHILQQLDRMLT